MNRQEEEKEVSLIHDIASLLLVDGPTDSMTIRKRLDINDRQFYPAMKILMRNGYCKKKKAFVGGLMYIKFVYFLTEEGKLFATRSRMQRQEIQIQR